MEIFDIYSNIIHYLHKIDIISLNTTCKSLNHHKTLTNNQTNIAKKICKYNYIGLLNYYNYSYKLLWKYAAKYASFIILEWLYDNEIKYYAIAHYTAAYYGHIKVMQWIRRNIGYFNKDRYLCTYAIKGNQPGMLKWLLQLGYEYNETATNAAVKIGNIKLLKMIENNLNLTKKTYKIAAKYNRILILNWLNHRNILCHRHTIAKTAGIYGNLKVIKWVNNQYEIPNEISTYIIKRGYHLKPCNKDERIQREQKIIKILNYLYQIGHIWPINTHLDAIEAGNIAVLTEIRNILY